MNQPPIKNSARIFFALCPTGLERTALAAWQPKLHRVCGGRVMRDCTLHATLVFLGEVGLHRLEALQQAAQEVEGHTFELALDTSRYWGTTRSYTLRQAMCLLNWCIWCMIWNNV